MSEHTDQEERVARAICSAQGLDPDHEIFGNKGAPMWRNFIRQARGAIAAMQEPATPELQR